MVDVYPGPVRAEPLAIELHNTLYASGSVHVDGLADQATAAAWLDAVSDRLPAEGAGGDPCRGELIALREVVRDVLRAATERRSPARASIEALNQASARAPHSPGVRWRQHGAPQAITNYLSGQRADLVISAIAANAIELVTGPDRIQLRSCGAPGCVLIFLKDHPRREWCSPACGNRARQARHYQRTRRSGTTTSPPNELGES
jgi:predicted RNA-binding Zn ribbon-like protein